MNSPLQRNPKLFPSLDAAVARRAELKAQGKKLVLTNGCFDLLHCGHVFYLREAAKLGDELWIALNAAESVRALKGPTRPVQGDLERGARAGHLRESRRLHARNTQSRRTRRFARRGNGYPLHAVPPGIFHHLAHRKNQRRRRRGNALREGGRWRVYFCRRFARSFWLIALKNRWTGGLENWATGEV